MTESLTISTAPFPHASMDFAALREAGIKYFEKRGTKLWTDFNLHDPGITILEVLCYAITDLGYRTNFPIEDVLASSSNYPGQKQFFSALEILTCNPVTENDFRKILIDLEGIKNAWLVKTQNQEMWIKIKDGSDPKILQVVQPPPDKKNNPSPVTLNGLYDVYIDLDDSVDHDDGDRVNDIVKCAWQQLWKRRNLCEDYVTIKVVEEIEFCIDLQVELCSGADVNEVAGKIYYSIQEFLTPTIQFYNFKEMYEGKKRSCEEIFEGPILCNGFIDDTELNNAQLRKEIYKSDLWQVIMDVCGVAAIKKLRISQCDVTTGDPWCLPISDNKKPKLNLKNSKIAFQREFDCVFADDRKVLERITLLQKLNKPVKKSHDQPPVQAGTDRNLEAYFSIQDEFPGTYKIAEGQITRQDSELRKAQVKQLKGYLLLFDELLADYLLLLSRVKDLLSVSQPEQHSYFYHTLYDIPGISDLVKAANRLTITTATIQNCEKLKIPADTIAALKDLKEGRMFESEKDFIYQLSVILNEKDIKSYELLILSQLQKNEQGQFGIIKNSDYKNLPPAIRNAIDALSNDFYKDEKQFLKEMYIWYCSCKIKKYYRLLIVQLSVLQANESSWNVFKGDDRNQFINALAKMVETETKRKQRKNIFLDHLLARFGESFTDYVVKEYQEQCSCIVSEEGISIDDKLLKRKAAFLQDLPELGSERGKGFNYKAEDCGKPDVWDTNNVAGLKKRVCKYLGYEDYKRKTLTCPPEFDIVPYRVISDGKVQKFRLRLQDKESIVLLDGIKEYRLQQNALKDAKDLREQVLRHVNVKDDHDLSTGIVVVPKQDAQGYSRVYVKDKEGNNALQSEMLKYEEALKLRDEILALAFPDCCGVEGFHIVEHILLRPKDDDYILFDPVLVPDKLAEKWNSQHTNAADKIQQQDIVIKDPYSFWITVVAPNWLAQFKNNPNAQNSFEQLVRRECPAHIVIKFCWLKPEEMYNFESYYLQWLYENALEEPNQRELTGHVNDLVKFMRGCSFTIRDIGDPCFK